MLLLHEAIARFDACNARSRVVNRQTGKTQQISKVHRDVIVSSVRAGVRHAAGQQEVDDVDIAPLLETLPELARLDAVLRDLDRPASIADRVRRFVESIEGRTYSRARGGRRYVLPSWLPLYDALAILKKTRPERASAILRLQNVALLGGSVRAPAELQSCATVKKWAKEQGLDRTQVKRMLDAYRFARRQLIAAGVSPADYPDIERGSRTDLRGVLSLVDLEARLASRGCTSPAQELGVMGVLRVLAPKFAQALEVFLATKPYAGRSPEWQKRQRGAVSRFVAALILAGRDASVVTPLSLLEETWSTTVDPGLNALAAEALGEDATPTQRISLLRYLLDQCAWGSLGRSPLKLHSSTGVSPQPVRDDAPPFYTDTVRNDVASLKTLTKSIYASLEHSPNAAAQRRWEGMVKEFDVILKHMKSHNRGVKRLNQKDKLKLLEQITYPQLVCIGLPKLRQYVRALKARHQRVLARHNGNSQSPAVARAAKRYATWLRRYLALAVISDDGLRVKNYAGARVGADGHFRPAVRTDPRTGAWVGFERVETFWRGFDEPHVCLKAHTDANGAERTRYGRVLLPGIVDHELLFDYWTHVRVKDLVAARLLTSTAAYNPTTDHFALFVSRRSRMTDGRYSTAALSEMFGKALHWVCIHALKREAVPPRWYSEERTRDWRALFTAHVSRLLIGTYIGGIRGDWQAACELTDASVEMLVKRYSKVTARVLQKRHLPGPENPRHYDAVMDRIFAGGLL